eukprot:6214707-Pleurochrysis_carterae.AAC.5
MPWGTEPPWALGAAKATLRIPDSTKLSSVATLSQCWTLLGRAMLTKMSLGQHCGNVNARGSYELRDYPPRLERCSRCAQGDF